MSGTISDSLIQDNFICQMLCFSERSHFERRLANEFWTIQPQYSHLDLARSIHMHDYTRNCWSTITGSNSQFSRRQPILRLHYGVQLRKSDRFESVRRSQHGAASKLSCIRGQFFRPADEDLRSNSRFYSAENTGVPFVL